MAEILERTQGVGRIEDDHDRIAFDAAGETSPNDALREVGGREVDDLTDELAIQAAPPERAARGAPARPWEKRLGTPRSPTTRRSSEAHAR